MRISDWSSDVCSSDLEEHAPPLVRPARRPRTENRNAANAIITDLNRQSGHHRLHSAYQLGVYRLHMIAPPRLVIVGRIRRRRSHRRWFGQHRARCLARVDGERQASPRSEAHTAELQSLMRISYAVFCLKKKKLHTNPHLPTSSASYTEHTNTQ